jgi:flagellin
MSFNSVNTNASAFQALATLRTSQAEVQDASKRIQTGYRVADASDDAGAFSVAQQVRGDIGGWDAVGGAQGRAIGSAKVALAGLEKISDLINELKAKIVDYAAGGNATQVAIKAQGISDLLTQIDKVAQTVSFDGFRPLMQTQLAFNPVGGVGLFSQIFNSTGVPYEEQSFTVTGLVPGTPSRVYIDLISGTNTEGAALFYRGAQTASRAIGSTTTPLVFDFDGTSPYDFEIKLALTPGSSITVSAMSIANPTPNRNGSVDIIRDPSGGQEELRPIDATRTGLGLGSMLPLPAPPGSVANILAAITFATSLIAQNTAYYANKIDTFEATQGRAKSTVDAYTKGLGALVDSDIGRDQARVEASRVREQLALQGVSVANQSQRSILGFLEGLSRG